MRVIHAPQRPSVPPAPQPAPARTSPYHDLIRDALVRQGLFGYDPRHIEGFMRIEHGTLDHLDRQRFTDEVRFCAIAVDEGGTVVAEDLAVSFGL